MSPMVSFLLFFSSLTILSVSKAQERAPHGIANENPIAFSPLAYDFFHPSTQKSNPNDACVTSNCSPLPIAAEVVESTEAHESRFPTTKKGGSRVGAGGIAGIVFGVAFVVLLAMGAYHVVTKRRANMTRTNTVQPDV